MTLLITCAVIKTTIIEIKEILKITIIVIVVKIIINNSNL